MVLEWEDHLLLLDAGDALPDRRDAGRRLDRPRLRVPRRAPRAACAAILLTHGHEDHIGALVVRARRPRRRRSTAAGSRSASRASGSRSAASHADLRTLRAGRARRDRPVPRPPDPRRPQRARQPRARDRDAGGRRRWRAATSRSTRGAPEDERTDLEALSRLGRPRRARAPLRQHERRAAPASPPARTRVVPAFEEVFDAHARARARLLLRHLDPAHAARGRRRRARRPAGRPSSAGAWSTTPRWRSTSALLRIAGEPPALRRPRSTTDAPRRRVRLGQPGRAALGAVDDQPRRAPRRRGGPRRHRRALGARRSPATSARCRASSATCSASAATSCTRAPRSVHVSGHGSQDDLVELLRRVRPRYLVPVHGEYRMLAQHARLAAAAGLPADRVLLAEDGDVLRLSANGRARGGRASRPAACSSTAAATRRSRTSWCATAATSRPRASWSRSSSWTARPGASSRRPRS